jgi:DNA-binding LacI/PurR family transcriptional regulator
MSKSNTVYQELVRRINNGLYRPGEKLPGEVMLAQELGVSRVTLRSALKQLVNEEIIETFGRSGNYVSMNRPGKRFLLLIGGSTEQLGIVQQYISSLLRQNLANAGHQLELLSVGSLKNVTVEEWNTMLLESGVEGVFLEPGFTSADTEILELFNNCVLPSVKVLGGGNHALYKFPTVSSSGAECFMDGVRYLASLGHRRICTVFAENCTRGIDLDLYREFLRCNGLCDDSSLIKQLSCAETKDAVRKELLGPRPPTAFMCFCDARALQVYGAVRDLGLRIPSQISVMGMSGYSQRLFAMPKLSMANFRYDLICAEAVKLMLRSEEWHGPGMEKILIQVPHTIEIYGSCAPPPEKQQLQGEFQIFKTRIFSANTVLSGDE